MSPRLTNYRKAKPGEVQCRECVHSGRSPFHARIRCHCGDMCRSTSVGERMTCDAAWSAGCLTDIQDAIGKVKP